MTEKLSDEEVFTIETLAERGWFDMKIAELIGRCRSTVGKYRGKAGIEVNKGVSEEEKKKIKKMNEKGIVDRAIGEELGYSQVAIGRVRNDMGLDPIYPNRGQKEVHKEIPNIIKNEGAISHEELEKTIGKDLDRKIVMRYLREDDEQINRICLTDRLVGGIGSERLYGNLANSVVYYTDHEEFRKKLKESCNDMDKAKLVLGEL